MTAQDARDHQADLRNQLSYELFQEASLKREIEILRPKFESAIVVPRITNIRTITEKDLAVDVVPVNLANMDTIQARKGFYYATKELAAIKANIQALITMYNSYDAHIQQEVKKQGKVCTEEMIWDIYHKALDLKNVEPAEKDAIKNISENILTWVNGGQEKRWEIYETLSNLVKQHS
jgi:hypothetical protein